MRKLLNKILRRHDCRDDLAHKIARYKGELAAVQHLMDHYQAKQFNPYSVPECWLHADKMQKLYDLKEEYSALTRKLVDLQNRDAAQLKRDAVPTTNPEEENNA